jgi:hypothetical protein
VVLALSHVFRLPQVSWEAIGNVANVLQIVTAIPILAAVIAWLMSRHRINRALIDLERGQGQKPAALALDFKGGSIRVQVIDFLKRKGIPIELSMVQEFSRPAVSPENAYTYLRELQDVRDQMIADGVTELHLFIRGPLGLAVGIGAIYDSNFPVHVYQYAQDTEPSEPAYQFWITLHQGSIAGMPASRVERTLRIAGELA